MPAGLNGARFLDSEPAQWSAWINLNLCAAMYGTHAVLVACANEAGDASLRSRPTPRAPAAAMGSRRMEPARAAWRASYVMSRSRAVRRW
jgi:hypothetical protein